MAAQDTDLDCGKWLAEDIADGLIAETDLTASGRRKLEIYRASIASPSIEEQLKFLDL